MNKTKRYFVSVTALIITFLLGVVLGHIMQSRQAFMWIEDMQLDHDVELFELIEENRKVFEELQLYQEALEGFLDRS